MMVPAGAGTHCREDSSFLSAHFHIVGPHSANPVSWIKAIMQNNEIVVQAADVARKAATLLQSIG